MCQGERQKLGEENENNKKVKEQIWWIWFGKKQQKSSLARNLFIVHQTHFSVQYTKQPYILYS